MKRFRSRALLAVSLLLLIVACQRDPGRDVKPMADPLRSAGPTTAVPDEIIPLDKVSKSQAAAVSQRIANSEITITYSRPLARGRELFGALVPYDQVWNPGKDQGELRLDVRPEQGPHMEVLAFYFPNVEGKDATLGSSSPRCSGASAVVSR